jgi:MOSC domain-containing protein YiiM
LRDAAGKPIRKAEVFAITLVGGDIRAGDPIRVELPRTPHRPLSPL